MIPITKYRTHARRGHGGTLALMAVGFAIMLLATTASVAVTLLILAVTGYFAIKRWRNRRYPVLSALTTARRRTLWAELTERSTATMIAAKRWLQTAGQSSVMTAHAHGGHGRIPSRR